MCSETHQHTYKEFPAGFNASVERLVEVEILRVVMLNLIPCISFVFIWKIRDDYEHLEHVDAIGGHIDFDDEYSWPEEGEILDGRVHHPGSVPHGPNKS